MNRQEFRVFLMYLQYLEEGDDLYPRSRRDSRLYILSLQEVILDRVILLVYTSAEMRKAITSVRLTTEDLRKVRRTYTQTSKGGFPSELWRKVVIRR